MVKLAKSYAPFILMTALALIVSGWLFSQWLQKIDYDSNQFQIIDARQFDIKDLEGYVVYLDFWAAWCAPCRQSFPWMHGVRERFVDTKLRIVAVNLDQEIEQAQAFLDENKVNFAVVFDPSYSLFRRYEIEGVPTSLLFDEKGEEVWRHVGFRQKDTASYERAIEEVLGL